MAVKRAGATRAARKRAPGARSAGGRVKLAEALILRADYQKRIEQLKSRLLRNAKVQEGERPAEDPAQLLAQFDQLATDLEGLIQRINRTNSASEIERGLTISDAIAVRDVLRIRHGVLRELAAGATVTQDRHTKSEVRFKSTVNVTQIQRQADDVAKRHRELDAKIQESNWQNELK